MMALLALALSARLYCDINALTPAERKSHRETTARLFASVRSRQPVSNGYSFTIDGSRADLATVSRWIALERKCCPFLRFRIDMQPGATAIVMRLTGPRGTRQFLDAELEQ